jgi:hypothetical protein
MSKKNKVHERTPYEVYRSIRKDWGDINPITKVIPDKRFKKPKHKNKEGYDD